MIVKSFTGVVTALSPEFVSAILVTEDNKNYNVDIKREAIPVDYWQYLDIGVTILWDVVKEDGSLYPKLRIQREQ